MATAEIVEFRERTNITPDGDRQIVLEPVFTLSPFAGTRTAEAIPRDEFSRDLARQRVRSLASELLSEDSTVTVSFPGE